MKPEDIIFEMATAHTRTSKHLSTRVWTWREMVDRCSRTQRTPETMAEYARMSRDEQGRIKDVGGFVGARLNGNQRRKCAVLARTLITLDLDYATASMWDDFLLSFDCAALVYSTHKHSEKNPRLRLVIPVSRPMTVAEYGAVCRRVADTIGIDQFDSTSYEAERLMYWPSTSKDGPYYFKHTEGDPLDVDEVLGTYHDWRDVSEWPVAPREWQMNSTPTREARDAMVKAGDPTEKPGVVGAFCLIYGIKAAMDKYLPGVYKPAGKDRYTYTGGSTSGGVLCYEDKWIYSHHDTDPTSRRLCNAFDMVRLHRFGAMDIGSEVSDIGKLPSTEAMRQLAREDPRVKVLLIESAGSKSSAADDFASIDDPTPESDDTDWRTQLDVNKKTDRVLNTIDNVRLILENDPAFGGSIHMDMFRYAISVDAPGVPWDPTPHKWNNSDDANLRCWLESSKYNITGREKIRDALEVVANRKRRHPIADWLKTLQWDGTPRLDTLLIDYLGAEDTKFNRMITRIHFTAAVARVMEPGIKYDYCPIFVGDQGNGKSSLIRIMGGEYYKDGLTSMEGKEGMEQLSGWWLIELGELATMNKSETNTVKQFITSQKDDFRPAFKERTQTNPRQCVFFGTTNEQYFLRDKTGNRRFPIIAVDIARSKHGKYFHSRLESEREQLWAEAYERYKEGTRLYLDSDMEEEMRRIQSAHDDETDDPWMPLLDKFLSIDLPETDWKSYSLTERREYLHHGTAGGRCLATTASRQRVSPAEFLSEYLFIDPTAKGYNSMCKRVARLCVSLGWEGPVLSRHAEGLYGRQKSYLRPAGWQPKSLNLEGLKDVDEGTVEDEDEGTVEDEDDL